MLYINYLLLSGIVNKEFASEGNSKASKIAANWILDEKRDYKQRLLTPS